MLGHLRTWGWLFNPLTLYYCFDPAGREVEWTVLEVSNTPWHERCRYVVGPPGTHTFAKAMHVSPFLPDHATYTLRYSAPAAGLHVGLDLEASAAPAPYGRWDETDSPRPNPQLAASMVLRRRPLDRAGLARLLWRHPLMTARVSGGIYAQAAAPGRRPRPVPPAPGTERDVPGAHDGGSATAGVRPWLMPRHVRSSAWRAARRATVPARCASRAPVSPAADRSSPAPVNPSRPSWCTTRERGAPWRGAAHAAWPRATWTAGGTPTT